MEWLGRPKRKRLVLGAVYDADGHVIDGDVQVFGAVVAEWVPVCRERQVVWEVMQELLNYIPAGAGGTEWSWPRRGIAEIVATMPRSAPGPGGIP